MKIAHELYLIKHFFYDVYDQMTNFALKIISFKYQTEDNTLVLCWSVALTIN